jgi:hypothetical protein
MEDEKEIERERESEEGGVSKWTRMVLSIHVEWSG